ncbi:MAG TPA: hypothetical protein VLA43_16275 [Longimicrobiales bacterium]|nr:hypothetical protein [Longimicrobiales bacterium]
MSRLFRGAALGAAFLAILLGLRPTAEAVDPQVLHSLSYRMVGPTQGGRVTAVAGHPSHPGTFYMGATGGGVWKTDDYGANWVPISDGYFNTGSIGAIRVAPSDPRVIYVGTGSDGIRSNVILGRGVYRSDDAGETWSFLGLKESGQVGAVEIHPENSDVAYVAALGNPFAPNDQRGVFRTRDGGRTWQNILFTSDSVGAIDLELHPTNPQVVYASMWRGERKPWTIISGMEEAAREDGIWRSEDGGDSWEYVPLNLPSGYIGKIDFAVTPADPDRVYAVVETHEPDEGLYRSDDAGRTWRLVSNHKPLMDRPFYYTNVDVDPTDPDKVWVSATQFWFSGDGGETWERRSTPHGDNHDLWINPDDPRVMIQSNDGGANVTRDGGETWSSRINQATAELYSLDYDDRFPRWLYSGQQDNGTAIMVPSDRPTEEFPGWAGWLDAAGCETGPAVPRPGSWNIVYANCKGRFGRYNTETGQEKQYYVGAWNLYGTNPANLEYRFQRVVPIEVSPHDPNTIYHGSQFVHRTRDEGVTWETISPDLTAFLPERQMVSGMPITRDATGEEHYSTLYVIEESPLQEGLIWTGSNDGPVHVTRDGGATWTDVTPPDLPPEGRIQNIDPSPHDPARAYLAAYRYLLGDFQPYLYKTEDYGRTWTRLTDGTNGIPADHPTRVVREDPGREGLLYAGTEFGIFLSMDDGATWASFQQNLPVTPITDLKVVDQNLYISTMGRSFWVMDDITPLHQLMDGMNTDGVQLLQPRDIPRTRAGGFGFGGGGSQAGPQVTPQWSPNGVLIDYWVPQGLQADLSLEVLDASGEVLKTYRSGGPGMRAQQDQGMRAPFTRMVGTATLATRPGLNRFVWDFSGPGAGRGGPLVPPGTYTIRLSVGDRSQSRDVRLFMDPRVAADGVTQTDLEEQYAISLEIAATMAEAQAVDRRVQQGLQRAQGDTRDGFQALDRRLNTLEEGSYQTPMLQDQLRYLYSMLQRADQKPGRDAYVRHEQLKTELEDIRRELERLERMVVEN